MERGGECLSVCLSPHSSPLPPSLLPFEVTQSAGRCRAAAAFVPRPAPPCRNENDHVSEQISVQRIVSPIAYEVRKRLHDGIVERGREMRTFSELNISNMSSNGFERGKADKPAAPDAVSLKVVNRLVKVVNQLMLDPSALPMSRQEAVKKAMEILRKKSEAATDNGRGRGE